MIQMSEELRYIVRIAGKDLNGTVTVERAIRELKGVGHRYARIIALMFSNKTGIPVETKLGLIPEEKDKLLEDIILQPEKFGVPGWALNRRKERVTGKDMHLIMADLDFSLRTDLQRLGAIKSYRGLRHAIGLPVRGQRTRSSFRRGGVVGVMKKEARKGK